MKHNFPALLAWICCLCLMMLYRPVTAQVASYAPPSPNAASLGVFGQIPVSEYNGVPDISIPLYTIAVNDFTLPVTLRYHSAGFRRADEASWVGLGWALTGGGVITRSKRHKDDTGPNGYYKTTGGRPCGDDYDQEPDMFYYNVGNYAGKFLLDAPAINPTTRYFKRDNVKITYTSNPGFFTMLDPYGNKYIFAEEEWASETTDNNTENFVSSWNLTSIELVNGDKITYTYLPLGAGAPQVSREFSSYSKMQVTSYSPSYINSCCSSIQQSLMSQSEGKTTTHLVREKLLTRIDYPGGSIQMGLSDRSDLNVASGSAPGKKLDDLKIYTVLNGVETYLKEFAFAYDVFDSGSSLPVSKRTRLRLRSVTEKTQAATQKPYQLNYISNFMPDKYSSPGHLDITGLVKSIVYPTGGASYFDFSPHPMGGGARIDRIYNKDPDNTTEVRRFEYTGGKLMGEIKWGAELLHQDLFMLEGLCCTPWDSSAPPIMVTINRKFTVGADFSSMGETVNGNIAGYDKVTTYFGENGENGRKESFFANTAPYNPQYKQGIVPIPVPLNTSAMNGSLLDEHTYKSNGVKLKHLHFDYEAVNALTFTGMRHAFDKCSEWSYPITVEWVRVTGETAYNYDENGANPVIESAVYTYGDPGNALPTSVTETDSKGNTILTRFSYAKQQSDLFGGVYTTMLNKNMIGIQLGKEELRNNVTYFKNTRNYQDWYGNGKVLKPSSEQSSRNGSAPVTDIQFKYYDERGRLLSFAKAAGQPVSLIWGAYTPNPVAEVFNADQTPVYELATQQYNPQDYLESSTHNISTTPVFYTNVNQTYNYNLRIVIFAASGTGIVEVKLFNTSGQLLLMRYCQLTGTVTNFSESVALSNGTGTMGYYFTLQCTGASPGTPGLHYELFSSYQYNRSSFGAYYNSFEDLPAGYYTSGGKTGEKCVTGSVSVPMPKVLGEYIVSWWQKPVSGGGWTYQEQTVIVTSTNMNDHSIGNASLLIDEVRLYPKGARMITYAYKPGVGLIGKCDERSRSLSYEYDPLHRLKVVRDEEGNYLKTYDYNYKNY